MHRAAVRLAQLRNYFHAWFNFYDLYDRCSPGGWTRIQAGDEALEAHAQLLPLLGVPGPLEAALAAVRRTWRWARRAR